MATLKKQGEELARWQMENSTHAVRFSLRTNGKLLRQARICGKWEGWKIAATVKDMHDNPVERVEAHLSRRATENYGSFAKFTRL